MMLIPGPSLRVPLAFGLALLSAYGVCTGNSECHESWSIRLELQNTAILMCRIVIS